MNEFTFDLQRFAVGVWMIGDEAYSTLANAIAAAPSGTATTIALKGDITDNGLTIATGKNVIIDLQGHTCTIDGSPTDPTITSSTKKFKIAKNATVTFQNGTFDCTKISAADFITSQGLLTLNNITLPTTSYVTSTAGTVTVNGATTLKAYSSSTTTDLRSNFILANGTTISPNSGNNFTLNTAADNSVTVTVPTRGHSYTVIDQNNVETTFTTRTANMSFSFDASGNGTVNNLADGKIFDITKDGQTVRYTVTAGGLQAVSGNTTKVAKYFNAGQQGNVAFADLDFDDESIFQPAYISSDGTITINSTVLKNMDSGDSLLVVDSSNFSKSYATLTKVSATQAKLTRTADNTLAFKNVSIDDGLVVEFTSNFQNIPISVTNSAGTNTSLTSATNTEFAIDNTSGASIYGANSTFNLTRGTLRTANSNQTIKAGDYKVANGDGDGINVIANARNTQVADIDNNESFTVNGKTYVCDKGGLRTADNSQVYASDVVTVATSGDKSFSVDLSKLNDSGMAYIQPDNEVLEIGTTHMSQAVIVNDTSNPTTKLGELKVNLVGSNNYYTLQGGNDGNASAFKYAVDTISLTGGANVTIYESLGGGITIAAGKGTTPDATFKVTNVGGSTFTVNYKTTTRATRISDATEITLLSGSLNATAGQTITFGEGGSFFTVDSSSKGVNVDFNNGIATITGLKNDTFTIDGKQYKITGTNDGVSFIVKDGKVTIADLTAADGDAFTSNGIKYTAYDVGFVRDNSLQTGRYHIWNNGNSGIYNHSLKGNSLNADALIDMDNWNAVATVSASNKSATIPPFVFSDTVTLVGDDFAKTYGTLTRDGNSNNYTLNRNTAEPQLTRVSVSGADELSAGDGFVNTRINGAVASLIVTADDSNPGYKVTLTSAVGETSAASISGANQVSLISGTLKADKNIGVSVRDNAHSINKVITAGYNTTLTIVSYFNSSDASIVGMSTGEQFNLDGADKYRFSEVGLVDANDHYLLGTKKANAIKLSAINTSSMWGGLIDVHALTINANTETALIVNDTSNPVSLYADFARSGNTRTLTKSEGTDDWQKNFVINVENTTVNAESYFANKTFHGVNSGAKFTVTKTTDNFTITDSKAGASVSPNATEINQTAGLFIPAANQSIVAGGHTFAWQTNTEATITITVESGNATINGLNNTDTFIVDGDSFEVIDNGLLKKNGTLFWKNGSIGTAVSLTDLANNANWNDTIQSNPTETFDNTSAAKVTLGSAIVTGDASARTKAITIVGNGLDNTILGGKANDAITGGTGDDSIFGDKGADKLYGQAGNDTLWGGTGNDALNGGAGDDVFVYSSGNDVINDYAEGDTISLGAAISSSSLNGSDVVFKIGSGTLTVKNGKDKELTYIDAIGKERTIIGGKEFLTLTDKNNAKVTASSKYELVDASWRKTAIQINGNSLDNVLVGGAGNDTLYGGNGADIIDGGNGDDYISGGNGNDTLWGGLGNDTLLGSAGADVFLYDTDEGNDVIKGFDNSDMLLITGAFSAAYDAKTKSIAFKVDSTEDAITINNFTATSFNINGFKYRISGTKLVKR